MSRSFVMVGYQESEAKLFSIRLPRLRVVTSAWPTYWRQALRRAGTHLFPVFTGTRNDRMGKGIHPLSRKLDLQFHFLKV
jgi:hypothetical protein